MTQQTILLATLCLIVIGGSITATARFLMSHPIGRVSSKLGLPPRTRSVFVRESVALDPKRRLHLVEWQERRILLLTGGPQDVVLDAAPDRARQL